MAIVRTDDKHYKAIADALREYAEISEKIFPEDMPAVIPFVKNVGWNIGYEAGKQAQYDALWDAIQDGGNRVDYKYAFSRSKWNSDTFKPKYNISPTVATELFRAANVGDDTTKRIDLIKLEEETGFKFDFSNCTNMAYAFADGGCILTIGEVDLRKCTGGESLTYAFYGGYGGTHKTEIKKIICDENTYFHLYTFDNLHYLQEIRFEGIIGTKGTNGMLFSKSTKLSHDSLMSIINALQDLTGTEITRSIVLGTTNLAKLTDAEKAIATQKGWSLT